MTQIRPRQQPPEHFVYYDETTGVISQILHIPPEMAELNRQPGESFLQIGDPKDIVAEEVRVTPGGQFEPYVQPKDPSLELGRLRAERNRRLALCDWTQVPDAPVDAATWQAYRQALRDVTESATSLEDVEWPTPPA
jgi:hypothetical protein